MDAATKSVTTDKGLASLSEIASLAQCLRKVPADGVQFVTVPTEAYPANPNRVQWTAAAGTLWQQIRTDTAGPSTATPTVAPTADPGTGSQLLVAPSNISVRVLNVGGTAGVAGTVSKALTDVGFGGAGIGDGTAHSATADVLVRYGTGRQESASTVAAGLGGATSQLDASLGEDIVVEVKSVVTISDVRSRVAETPAAAPTPTPRITGRVASGNICA